MSEPNQGREPLWLDRTVAVWLHKIADEHYGGDVEKAMNEALRAMMAAEANPEDPWAAINLQSAFRRYAEKD